jgi:hypothetical protein
MAAVQFVKSYWSLLPDVFDCFLSTEFRTLNWSLGSVTVWNMGEGVVLRRVVESRERHTGSKLRAKTGGVRHRISEQPRHSLPSMFAF